MYFQANDGIAGAELWRFSGSEFFLNGPTVTVTGGNEVNNVTINFTSPTNYTITRNGVTEAFSTTAYPTIIVDTGGGNDTLIVGLSTLADSATFNNRSGAITSSNYTITHHGVETQYLFGGTTDSARFQDSLANDLFWALPSYSIMTAVDNSFFNQVIGFGPNITVNASAGFDVAQLIGTGSADAYVAA